jgi:diaminopimelate epimerase
MGTVTFGTLEFLQLNGRRYPVTSLSIGNPHCVVIVDDLAKIDARGLGPVIESHPAFPDKTNVQFAEILSRTHIAMEIWERGVGYTLASGTSSCAVAAAAHRKALVDREVSVSMPGGELEVTIGENYAVRLRGPVEEVTTGDFSCDLLRRLAS